MKQPGEWVPIYWRELYRRLWHCDLHLSPEQVDRLTMGEIALACDGDMRPRPADGTPGVCMSAADIMAEIERRQHRTLAERIAEARGD